MFYGCCVFGMSWHEKHLHFASHHLLHAGVQCWWQQLKRHLRKEMQEKVTGSVIDMPWLSLGMKIRVLMGILHFKFHAGCPERFCYHTESSDLVSLSNQYTENKILVAKLKMGIKNWSKLVLQLLWRLPMLPSYFAVNFTA